MNGPAFARVQLIAADLFNLSAEQVTAQMSPDSVDSWDSIRHLDLVLALEQEFSLQFSPEEVEAMKSIERIAALIDKKCVAVR